MIPAPQNVTPDARRTANRLVDELERERIARRAAPDSSALGSWEFDVKPAHIEQAKGALMLHFGVNSHQAFAVLLGWARTSQTSVAVIVHTLLRGVCEGNPQTEMRQRALVRWLEVQLSDDGPDDAQLSAVTSRWRTGT